MKSSWSVWNSKQQESLFRSIMTYYQTCKVSWANSEKKGWVLYRELKYDISSVKAQEARHHEFSSLLIHCMHKSFFSGLVNHTDTSSRKSWRNRISFIYCLCCCVQVPGVTPLNELNNISSIKKNPPYSINIIFNPFVSVLLRDYFHQWHTIELW